MLPEYNFSGAVRGKYASRFREGRHEGRKFRPAPQHSPSKVRRKARKQEVLWAARGFEASPAFLDGEPLGLDVPHLPRSFPQT